ncbi:hypothetical protein Nmel_003199 [Mimus melanotis]
MWIKLMGRGVYILSFMCLCQPHRQFSKKKKYGLFLY